jgi:hypothetical protein
MEYGPDYLQGHKHLTPKVTNALRQQNSHWLRSDPTFSVDLTNDECAQYSTSQYAVTSGGLKRKHKLNGNKIFLEFHGVTKKRLHLTVRPGDIIITSKDYQFRVASVGRLIISGKKQWALIVFSEPKGRLQWCQPSCVEDVLDGDPVIIPDAKLKGFLSSTVPRCVPPEPRYNKPHPPEDKNSAVRFFL